jgi:Spy/CpxP family protein refolding chaperone
MEKRIVAFIVSALVIVFGASYALADEHSHNPAQHEGQHSHGGAGDGKDYDLSADQRAKLNDLRLKFKEETAELKGKILTKKLQTEALWMNPKSDPKAILERENELAELQKQMHEKRAQLKVEARKVYTPEQLAHFGMRGFGSMHRHRHMRRYGAEGRHEMHGGGSWMGHGEHQGMEGGMHPGMGMMRHGMGHGSEEGMGMEMCKCR